MTLHDGIPLAWLLPPSRNLDNGGSKPKSLPATWCGGVVGARTLAEAHGASHHPWLVVLECAECPSLTLTGKAVARCSLGVSPRGTEPRHPFHWANAVSSQWPPNKCHHSNLPLSSVVSPFKLSMSRMDETLHSHCRPTKQSLMALSLPLSSLLHLRAQPPGSFTSSHGSRSW